MRGRRSDTVDPVNPFDAREVEEDEGRQVISRFTDFWSVPYEFENNGVPIPWGPGSGASMTIEFRANEADPAPLLTISTTSSAAGQVFLGPAPLSPPGSNQSFLRPGGMQFFTAKASNELLACSRVWIEAVATWANGTQSSVWVEELEVRTGFNR